MLDILKNMQMELKKISSKLNDNNNSNNNIGNDKNGNQLEQWILNIQMLIFGACTHIDERFFEAVTFLLLDQF